MSSRWPALALAMCMSWPEPATSCMRNWLATLVVRCLWRAQPNS